jgi:hypothetical protein
VAAKHVQILLMLDNEIKQQSIKQCADELASKCIISSTAAAATTAFHSTASLTLAPFV